MSAFPHLDAAQGVFFARQLEEIDKRNYDKKYAALEIFELVSPKTDMHPATETYTYRQFDGRAVAEMTSNYATGSPRADVDGVEFTSKVRSVRNSIGYNVQEIRAAARENVPLEAMRANVARRGINEAINRIGLMGSAPDKILGLFNQPNAQVYTVPATGTGSSTTWATKTPTQILADLYGIVDQIPTVTHEIERPNRLLLPHSLFRLISTQRIVPESRDTILEAFKIARPGIEVRGALRLDTAGVGGKTRAVAFDASPEACELLLPIAFESFAPQLQGMEYVIENHARMGGVVCRFPLSMIYADGL